MKNRRELRPSSCVSLEHPSTTFKHVTLLGFHIPRLNSMKVCHSPPPPPGACRGSLLPTTCILDLCPAATPVSYFPAAESDGNAQAPGPGAQGQRQCVCGLRLRAQSTSFLISVADGREPSPASESHSLSTGHTQGHLSPNH